ncbi:high frequency lysogenization protein HflD [Pseudoalteromonas sp. T1lg65]|uniref:high frequency lysogenization protein HflD n=1 Tax=Pseudoalteromonas sp. T1lg65 TaxID=2077101 RepID=UPI003F79EB75
MQNQYVMPLAAMCQITKLVQKCARYGTFNDYEVEGFLKSILNTSPERPEDVYPDKLAIKEGCQAVIKQLSSGPDKDVELVKYVGSLMQLERVLSNDKRALSQLGDKIQQVERQLLHFDICESQIIAALADIYEQVISPMGPKIQVFGKPELLKQKHIQQKVRALLLAGIRSAVLWRQLGGKRRQFFFAKKSIISAAKSYL